MKFRMSRLAPQWRTKTKFRSEKTTVDGVTFDSKAEAEYFCYLKLLLKAHEVKKFNTQVPYELVPAYERKGKKIRAMVYKADFVVDYADGHTEVVDVKGVQTKEYLLKRKLLLYQHPEIDFVEVHKKHKIHI